jgi:hypothetical protein
MSEGLDTGSDAGTPGQRAAVAPDDAVTAAVQDDAPMTARDGEPVDGDLPTSAVGLAGDAPDDGLTPTFREAPD